MANRLHLDFSIEKQTDRASFLDAYLQQPQFVTKPPTPDELETMANYVLWGKNEQGLNARQEKLYDIKSKHSTWDSSDAESLEGLMEQPAFNEASLQSLDAVPFRTKREVFSREKALAECPEYLKPIFIDLFRQIDELDLKLNYYDLAHGRRKNPPREQLLAQFSPEEQLQFQETVSTWSQHKYLKRRHELVELRREQYNLRDQYTAVHAVVASPVDTNDYTPHFDTDIIVRPAGIVGGPSARLVFRPWEQFIPLNYTEEELKELSDWYWARQKITAGPNQFVIDFRELEHVYQLLDNLMEFEGDTADASFDSTLPQLLNTLKFYVERAELSEVHKDILNLKLNKVKNADIACEVNKKWGKTYTTNYISTIFRQRIIPRINAAAAYHVKLLESIYFEEEFKTCSACGRTMLRDADNYTRRARSKDGFSGTCKACEKEARQNRQARKEDDTNDTE